MRSGERKDPVSGHAESAGKVHARTGGTTSSGLAEEETGVAEKGSDSGVGVVAVQQLRLQLQQARAGRTSLAAVARPRTGCVQASNSVQTMASAVFMNQFCTG